MTPFMSSNYVFKGSELAFRQRAYTFDDVLLMPTRSGVESRSHVDLKSALTKRFDLKLPFVAANMDTVSEREMCIAMNKIGAAAILHRFMSIEQQIEEVKAIRAECSSDTGVVAASIGVADDAKERAKALVNAGVNILTVDVAHGHCERMIDLIPHLKGEFSGVDIIAGNVATPQAAEDLIKAGADSIKVGIGPGSMCTTRVITGVGVPQLTAVAACAEMGRREGVPIIADGGIKSSGDATKAFCVGAQSIMLGSMLAGCLETPGELVSGRKAYRGMASRAAQTSWRGGELPEGMAPEGESHWVSCKGPVAETVHEIAGGVRSGMSYLNSSELSEVMEFAYFVEVSSNAFRENQAHGLLRADSSRSV